MSGQLVTLRTPVAMFPATPAKLAFQSFQRTAFSSPPWPKYRISSRGAFLASPLK